jgi:hypothetical protein
MPFPSFKGIAVLGDDEVLYSFFPRQAIAITDERLQPLVDSIVSGGSEAVRSLPGAITKFLSADDSNLQALAQLNRLRLDSHVVVGKDHKLVGIVEKTEILTQLLLEIARIDKAAPSTGILLAIAGLEIVAGIPRPSARPSVRLPVRQPRPSAAAPTTADGRAGPETKGSPIRS